MSLADIATAISNQLQLGDSEVHVWRIDLDRLAAHVPQWQNILSADENERAERFRFHRLRSRFVIRRGILRALLATYLNGSPEQLRFRYSETGKPALDTCQGSSKLQFSSSHSCEIALLAFAQDRELGVDVERVRADFDIEGVAKRFFSDAEQKALFSLPPTKGHEAFFNCWTRKEAFAKATGDGLTRLDQFDVSLAPGQPARLLNTRPNPETGKFWSLASLDAGPGYAAALAVRDPCPRIRMIWLKLD